MIPRKPDAFVTSTPLRRPSAQDSQSRVPVVRWWTDSRYVEDSVENKASVIAFFRQEANVYLEKIFRNEREPRYQDTRKRLFLEGFRFRMVNRSLPSGLITMKDFQDLLNACGKRYRIQFSTQEVFRIHTEIRRRQRRSFFFDNSRILKRESGGMSPEYESRLFSSPNDFEYYAMSPISNFKSQFCASEKSNNSVQVPNCSFNVPLQKSFSMPSISHTPYQSLKDISKDSAIMSPESDFRTIMASISQLHAKCEARCESPDSDYSMPPNSPSSSYSSSSCSSEDSGIGMSSTSIKTIDASSESTIDIPADKAKIEYESCKTSFYTSMIPQQWDFLKELNKRGCYETTSLLLSFLAPKDLQVVSSVSRSWRDVVVNDKVANVRRCKYLSGRKRLGKENKHGAKSGKTCEDRVLFQNLANQQPKRAKQPLAKPSANPVYDSFIEVAKNLKKQSDMLLKCPKCLFPSKSINGSQYCCTRQFCLYEFCSKCNSPFTEGHQCKKIHKQEDNLPTVLIGSMKSKRSLRRL